MICHAKLSLPISIRAIQEETQQLLKKNGWMPHFNTYDYEGDWQVLPLRSPGGNTDNPFADLMWQQAFEDTQVLSALPEIRKLLNSLNCEKQSARLLNLKAGSFIKKHRDFELSFEKGEARLHFPIFSNERVDFYIDDELVKMKPNECWYINANLPHSAHNAGNTDRIHLVVDCIVNDWLKEIFERSEKKIKKIEKDENQQRMIIETLRLQNTPTSLELAQKLENELNNE